jgi:glucosamine-6-phosphate deaminase
MEDQMPSALDPEALFAWCRIPTDELEGHPDAKVPIKVFPTPDDVHRWVARAMADELIANNAAGIPTRWIIPAGPTGQYAYFTQHVNAEKISLQNLHVFHMDEYLDWEARHLPLDHPFSLEGLMNRIFYAPIDADLAVPLEHRHFPSVYDIDALSEAIEAAGGIDTAWGGVGYRGHIAFNEPPLSPWYTITTEMYRNSRTRILPLNDDTIIARSQRDAGGLSHFVPPMAITIGMKDILSAKRIRIFSDTGAWKQTVVRVTLFGPVTVEYPVTFIQEHSDPLLVVDQETARPPLGA